MPTLPWLYRARLVRQGGETVLDNVPCSVWPAQSTYAARSGQQSTHTGELPMRYRDPAGGRVDAAAALDAPNLALVLDDGPMAGEYGVVVATPQPMSLIPHVGLQLRSRGAR